MGDGRATPTTVSLGTWTARFPKLLTSTVNGAPGKRSMTPWAGRHNFLCAVLGGFSGTKAPHRCCDAYHRLGHRGYRDPLTTRMFRDGTFVGNCARFRSAEFSSCGSCCDGPLEAILWSCLEGVTPVSATDGA